MDGAELLAMELDAGSDDAGADDDAGAEDAGSDEAGDEDAGSDEAGALELNATDELLFDFLLSLPPQATKDAVSAIMSGIFLSMLELLK